MSSHGLKGTPNSKKLMISENTALKCSTRASFVLSVGIIARQDYLCDLGTAVSEAADSLGPGSQVLSRLPEDARARFRKLVLQPIGQVVQDADAVLRGLRSRYLLIPAQKAAETRLANFAISPRRPSCSRRWLPGRSTPASR